MTQIQRSPVWGTGVTEEVVGLNNNSAALTIPTGATGFELSNDSVTTVFITPQSGAPYNTGWIVPTLTSRFINLEGAPTIYAAAPAGGIITVNVTYFYD